MQEKFHVYSDAQFYDPLVYIVHSLIPIYIWIDKHQIITNLKLLLYLYLQKVILSEVFTSHSFPQ